MKLLKLFFVCLTLSFFTGCANDPCEEDINSIECDTGDFDGDGVMNGEDSDPEDPCVPNRPAFENNVIGTWSYTSDGINGSIKINADGTYEDIQGVIISNGEVQSRTWRVVNSRLIFDVENASLSLSWITYDCNSFLLDGEGFIPDIRFNRR